MELCNDIIAEEWKEERAKGAKDVSDAPETKETPATEVYCRLCSRPVRVEEFIMVPGRGPLCIPCIEKIRRIIQPDDVSPKGAEACG